jgi:hypothetical protein
MSIVSLADAGDLLEKLLRERIPVSGFFMLPSLGVRAGVRGFVDSATVRGGLVVSAGSPPGDSAGFVAVPLTGRPCEFLYGEERELPAELRERRSASMREESALAVRFLDDGSFFILYFTI